MEENGRGEHVCSPHLSGPFTFEYGYTRVALYKWHHGQTWLLQEIILAGYQTQVCVSPVQEIHTGSGFVNHLLAWSRLICCPLVRGVSQLRRDGRHQRKDFVLRQFMPDRTSTVRAIPCEAQEGRKQTIVHRGNACKRQRMVTKTTDRQQLTECSPILPDRRNHTSASNRE
jgi:hypothetical protein